MVTCTRKMTFSERCSAMESWVRLLAFATRLLGCLQTGCKESKNFTGWHTGHGVSQVRFVVGVNLCRARASPLFPFSTLRLRVVQGVGFLRLENFVSRLLTWTKSQRHDRSCNECYHSGSSNNNTYWSLNLSCPLCQHGDCVVQRGTACRRVRSHESLCLLGARPHACRTVTLQHGRVQERQVLFALLR